MRRNKKGFTITEMLVVIAIMAVLSAVAIPAILALRHDLKMTELNSVARELFLAAQNDLTARRAAGTLGELGELVEGEDLMLLYNDDAAMAKLLPAGTVEGVVAGGHYALRLNPESATMFEVFYSEDVFTSDEVNGIESQNLSGADGTQARWEAYIGYYNGDDLGLGKVTPLSAPVLEIINEDELKVIVTVPNATNYWGAGVKLTVTVEALDGTGASFRSENCSYIGGTYEWVLDSLTGAQFKNICSGITPGADILVTAKLSADDTGDTRYLSAQASAQTNSLFADGSKVEDNGTIYVAGARHLQNLDAQFANGGTSLTSAADKFYVEQTAVITWPGEVWFQSISSHAEIAGFNGNKLEIIGLKGKNGLFAYVSGCTMKNIYIVNPALALTGSDSYAGAGCLAGSADNSTIDGCRVYSDALPGGGVKSSIVNNSTSAQYTGGLIGRGKDVAIRDCFSALHAIHAAGGNSVIGGLAGYLDTSSVINCYAVVDQMSGTSVSAAMLVGNTTAAGVTIKNCYAVGNITATTGTISGFANGGAAITNSYCAVTYLKADGEPTGATVTNGFAQGGDNTCVYLAAGITPTNAGENAKSKSYREMIREWNPWGTNKATAVDSHPYQEDLEGRAYPYPALSVNGGVFPHYGSWPEQSADGIKLYDGNTKDSKELHVILIPVGKQSTTVYAEVQSGGKNSMQQITVTGPKNSSIINANHGIQTSYDKTTGRTAITITTKQNNTGVTYFDLTAGGITLRAVVVAYKIEVTLTGNNPATKATAIGKMDHLDNSEIGQLILRTNGKVGEFTASLTTLDPTKTEILSELAKMKAGIGAQTALSATEADFNDWDQLKSGDPAVIANGNPEAGSNILAPVDGNYYPTADDTGKLTVTGVASGTATVSARWAMDNKVEAKCDVKMEGARALIQAVSAERVDKTVLGMKNDYPYYLGLRAEPGETVILFFTPKLFGGSGTEQSYTWTISGGTLGTLTTETKAVSGGDDDVWSYDLTGNTGWNTYTVTLEYNNDKGERSVDYMTFSVYCAAKKKDAPYDAIQIENTDDGQGFLNGDTATVEQINGSDGSGYEHTAELELQSWVEGAENTRVKWSYSTDGGTTWSPVTGRLGSIPVYETLENGTTRMRATVQWMNGDLEFNGKATGGAIKIVGLDANEYDSDFTFKLRSEAAEATENGEAIAAARTVDVTVMRKLKITPENLTKRNWGTPANGDFEVNRRDAVFAYQWFVNGEPSIGDFKKNVPGTNGTKNVEVYYGPHIAKATFVNINLWSIEGFVNDIDTGISWDVEKEGNQFFLVEKGKTKGLTYSWGAMALRRYDVSTSPVSTDYADIENTGSNVVNSGESGSYTYSVTGKKFTENEFQSMTWVMKKPRYWAGTDNIPSTHYLAVVGVDLKQGDAIVSNSTAPVSLSAPGATTMLTADWSFPSDLMVGTEPTITWSVDNPELVAFGTDITSVADTASGESISIVAKKYSAEGYSATVTAECTVQCINGREYTYKKYVSVNVPFAGGMTVTVEPCAAGDIAELNAVFGDGLTTGSLLAAVDGSGTPVLIRDSAFGCDTLYLKIRAGMSGGGFANLNDYFCNLYIDRSFVDMETALSADGTTMYVRLKAKEATADVCHLELRTAIGSAPEHKQPIDLYDHPEITLTRKNNENVDVDVTNGSIPVYLNETNLSVTLKAALTPVLYSAADTGKTAPLDQIRWYLQGPEGYDAQSYLKLSAEEGNEVTLSIRNTGRMPDFRVVLHARSARSNAADAGYALVFLPENST